MKTYRFVLTGLGNVGRNFLEILHARQWLLKERYGVRLVAVGLADSSGVAASSSGLELPSVIALKRAGRGVCEMPETGRPGGNALALIEETDADLLLEATPSGVVDAQPGLELVRRALDCGMHAVLASKGPLVKAFQELADLSDVSAPGRPALRFSAAVGGAMPSLNVGRRDLAAGKIDRIEGVLNGTTQLMLRRMTEGGSYDSAMAEARRVGIAEPDPSLDVDGWDTANKLAILANAVLRVPTELSDVSVTGIRGVTPEQLQEAKAAGRQMVLLAVAEALPSKGDNSPFEQYQLTVKPTVLSPEHPLAHLGPRDMGLTYRSDIHGLITIVSRHQGPEGASAAMLRDVLDIARAI